MDEKEKNWLKDIFPQYMAEVLRGVNIDAYKKAEQLISGRITTPDCGCQFHSYQAKVNQLYDEWLKENM